MNENQNKDEALKKMFQLMFESMALGKLVGERIMKQNFRKGRFKK